MDTASTTAHTATQTPRKGVASTIVLSLIGFVLFLLPLLLLYRIAVPPNPVAERAVERRAILAQTSAYERAAATEILWVDKEAGLVSVPPAMIQEEFLKELSARPVQPSSVPVNPLAAVNAVPPAGDSAAAAPAADGGATTPADASPKPPSAAPGSKPATTP